MLKHEVHEVDVVLCAESDIEGGALKHRHWVDPLNELAIGSDVEDRQVKVSCIGVCVEHLDVEAEIECAIDVEAVGFVEDGVVVGVDVAVIDCLVGELKGVGEARVDITISVVV